MNPEKTRLEAALDAFGGIAKVGLLLFVLAILSIPIFPKLSATLFSGFAWIGGFF